MRLKSSTRLLAWRKALLSFLLATFFTHNNAICANIKTNTQANANSSPVEQENPDLDNEPSESRETFSPKESKKNKGFFRKTEIQESKKVDIPKLPSIYFGADLQYQTLSMGGNSAVLSDGTKIRNVVRNQYSHEVVSPNFFLGFDSQINFKIELGFSNGSDSKTNNSSGIGANSKGELGRYDTKNYSNRYSTFSEIEINSRYFEVKPYKMLDSVTAIYGIFGLTNYEISIKEQSSVKYSGITRTTSGSYSTNKTVPNFGAGLEFQFFRNFFLRAQLKYAPLNTEIKTDQMAQTIRLKNIVSASFGALYNFEI